MRTRIAALALAASCGAVPALAQTAQVLKQDKSIDVASFKTFSYQVGHAALLKEVDQRIQAGIEAQLVARGLQKAASGPGDLVYTYHSIQRQDVDLATVDKKGPGGEKLEPTILKVGTLALDLKEGSTGKLAWRGKIEGVLTGDHAAQLETVDKAIAALFEKYPGNKAPGK